MLFFEQEYVAFEVLDVFRVKQERVKNYNSRRHFDAISFRTKADTVIETATQHIDLHENSVCFFPSRVDYTRISKQDELIVIHFNTFHYHGDRIEYFYPPDPTRYDALFREILQCWEQKDIDCRHRAAALLHEILAACCRDNRPQPLSDSKIEHAIRYIDENCLKQDFSLPKAAACSYISDVYFRKLFREHFHTSPKQYVITRRIKHAASLIGTGYYSLQEISAMCGYRDYKYFSVEFKKLMGVSPSQYTYRFYT